MSSKRCIFKNCTTTGNSGEVTLFSFPKDPTRKKTWLEIAGRSQHTLQKADYLCELHFGPQFISTNQRRKILVGLAVPFRSYQQQQGQQIENEDEMLEDRLEDNDDEIHDIFDGEEDDEFENYSVDSVIEHETITDSPETIVCDDTVAADIGIGIGNRKRKVITAQTTVTNGSEHPTKPVKIEKVELNSIRSKPNNGLAQTTSQLLKEKVISKVCTTTVIDHPDVSIFNIRGEEFIQMPKTVYLEEKERLENSQKNCYAEEISKLRKELDIYKNIVLNIKNELKTVPT